MGRGQRRAVVCAGKKVEAGGACSPVDADRRRQRASPAVDARPSPSTSAQKDTPPHVGDAAAGVMSS